MSKQVSGGIFKPTPMCAVWCFKVLGRGVEIGDWSCAHWRVSKTGGWLGLPLLLLEWIMQIRGKGGDSNSHFKQVGPLHRLQQEDQALVSRRTYADGENKQNVALFWKIWSFTVTKRFDFSFCKTQPPASIGWVALSSLIVVRMSRIVTPPLISTIWCLRPCKPYIFSEDMILATV